MAQRPVVVQASEAVELTWGLAGERMVVWWRGGAVTRRRHVESTATSAQSYGAAQQCSGRGSGNLLLLRCPLPDSCTPSFLLLFSDRWQVKRKTPIVEEAGSGWCGSSTRWRLGFLGCYGQLEMWLGSVARIHGRQCKKWCGWGWHRAWCARCCRTCAMCVSAVGKKEKQWCGWLPCGAELSAACGVEAVWPGNRKFRIWKTGSSSFCTRLRLGCCLGGLVRLVRLV